MTQDDTPKSYLGQLIEERLSQMYTAALPAIVNQRKSKLQMNKPHKHAEVIKAWADGASIEFRYDRASPWKQILVPLWKERYQYRVKTPENQTVYAQIGLDPTGDAFIYQTQKEKPGALSKNLNVRCVFDGETNELISITTFNAH